MNTSVILNTKRATKKKQYIPILPTSILDPPARYFLSFNLFGNNDIQHGTVSEWKYPLRNCISCIHLLWTIIDSFYGEKFRSECHQYKFCVFIFWMEWALYFEKWWSQFRFSILVKLSPLKWIEDLYHQPDILKNLARERNDSRNFF